MESGKRLILADILVDEEGFAQKATQIAFEKLQEILKILYGMGIY